MANGKKKSIKANAALSVIKQLFSILFPMLTVYYASRALGQDRYGSVNYIRSIVSYFHLFAGLGVATYAVREGAAKRDDKEQFSCFVNEVFTTNVISTIIAVAALIVFIILNQRNDIGAEIPLVIIFSFTIFVPTIGLDWVNTIYEDYAYLTVRYIIIHFISLLLMYLLVSKPSDYIIYGGLVVLSSVGGSLFNIHYVRRYVKVKVCSPKKSLKHLTPILILFSSTVASTIYINSDTTILGALIDNRAVAIYSVASQIYIAVKHISNSAITVTVPRLAYYVGNDNEKAFNSLLNKVGDYALSILLPTIVGLFSISKPLMIFMGGEGYEVGSQALQILSCSLFFAVIAYVLSRCVLIPNKDDRTYLFATIISAAVNIGLNFYFIRKWSYTGAAITTLISEMIVCGVFFFRSKKYYRMRLSKKNTLICIIACTPIGIICKAFTFLHLSHVYIITTVFLSAAVYFILLYIFKHPLMQEVKRIIMGLARRFMR